MTSVNILTDLKGHGYKYPPWWDGYTSCHLINSTNKSQEHMT